MLNTILVPLDGSPLAARALVFARRLAVAGAHPVVLLRAYLPDPGNLSLRLHYPEQSAIERANLDRGLAQAQLIAAGDRLRRSGLTVAVRFVEKAPSDAIVETAAATDAGLIVLATHAYGGLRRWVRGSVTDEVLRRAEIPVLVIPAAAIRRWPAHQPMSVLMTLDGSGLAQTVIEPALVIAEDLQAPIILLSVVEPPPVVVAYGETLLPPDAEQELADVRLSVEQTARDLRTRTQLPVVVRVAYGDAATSICTVARETHAAVIAMATHGRGGLRRLVMGSVATQVLEHAEFPVLLYRPMGVRAEDGDVLLTRPSPRSSRTATVQGHR